MIRVNGKTLPLERLELSQLLAQLGYDREQPGIAVAVNGEVVSRRSWSSRLLEEGDEVEIVGAVQGG